MTKSRIGKIREIVFSEDMTDEEKITELWNLLNEDVGQNDKAETRRYSS